MIYSNWFNVEGLYIVQCILQITLTDIIWKKWTPENCLKLDSARKRLWDRNLQAGSFLGNVNWEGKQGWVEREQCRCNAVNRKVTASFEAWKTFRMSQMRQGGKWFVSSHPAVPVQRLIKEKVLQNGKGNTPQLIRYPPKGDLGGIS